MHHGCPVDSCFLLRYLDDRRGGGDLLLEPRQQGGMKNEDGMKTKDVVFHNVSLMEGRLCVCVLVTLSRQFYPSASVSNVQDETNRNCIGSTSAPGNLKEKKGKKKKNV